ncbi:MAG: DUF2283 domain-containing protein [Candidatus Rokuibacteriota bacterium]
MLKEPYLEVTYRHGRVLAAYLYLPREAGEKTTRTTQAEPGMIIDYDRHGKPIGIEITAPAQVSAADVNRLLTHLGLSPLEVADLEPLCAA